MKTIAIIAAGMLASSVMSVEAARPERGPWVMGDQLRVCFPNRRLPDERPQDCILTAHPLSSDTHAGGPSDKGKPPELKWEKVSVDRVEHHDDTPPDEDQPSYDCEK